MPEAWVQARRVCLRSVQRGAVNFAREKGWFAALGALCGVLVLAQLLVLLIFGMQATKTVLESRVDLRLELLEQADNQDVQVFLSTLGQQPFVSSISYITKEQAYAQMQAHDPTLIAFIEEFDLTNPFPETVAIVLRSIADYRTLSEFLAEPQWGNIVDPTFLSETTNQEAYLYELLDLTATGYTMAFVFLLITGGIILFVTVELVRSRVMQRADEILIEHLSGAFPMAILIPFAVEAMLLLLLATIGSLLMMGILFWAISNALTSISTSGALSPLIKQCMIMLRKYGLAVLLLEAAMIPLMGWLGAWLGILAKTNMRSLALHRHDV
ncbi:MAG: permease-like cell division protein FtsX [Candidatus Peribacteraceae bacterium]|nr:hypothetical protein [Candidatus Peribacteria bacterium]